MSASSRDDRAALVVLALLVAAIVIIALCGLYARHEAVHPIDCFTLAHVNGEEAQEDDVICPDDHIFFGDGWAQWIMATFAIVATGVSWRALFLLRETFKETKRTADAATTANLINQDATIRQLRAYVGVRRVDVVIFGVGKNTRIEAVFVNSGQTPAKRIRLMFLTVGAASLAEAKFPIGRFKDEDLRVGYFELGPGETYTAACTGAIALDVEAHQAFTDKEYFIVVGALLQYEDVFGKKHRVIMRGHLSFFPDGKPFIDASNVNNRGD